MSARWWGTPDAPRDDRADDDAENKWRHNAGGREDVAGPLLNPARRRFKRAKGERRAAQYDADQHERERDVQHHAQIGEDGGEAGEEEDHHQDEPHVIGFPDRAHGMRDRGTLALPTRATCQQIPDTAAEVRASEEGVGHEGDKHDRRHRLWP